MSTPSRRAPALLAAFVFVLGLFGPSHSKAAGFDPTLGPAASFTRAGSRLCVLYVYDASFNLYRDRISAYQDGARLPLKDLPTGVRKSIAGVEEIVIGASFKTCVNAPSPVSDIQWIDQSCMSAQGICLPPRGFSIGADARPVPMDSSRAAMLFSQSLHPATSPKPPQDGWSFGFKPLQGPAAGVPAR